MRGIARPRHRVGAATFFVPAARLHYRRRMTPRMALPAALRCAAALLCIAAPARAIECPPCGPEYCLDDPEYLDALGAKKKTLVAAGYPPRLVALLDGGSPCVACVESAPDGFTVVIVNKGGGV